MSRYGGNSGEPAEIKEPLVFGKNAYRMWIALCIAVGLWFVGITLIWLISFGV